ncbi:MAG: cupin domain-containing protein, partial [Ignavibacteriales bacterium]|nr:cupin domain-containing protein [Ignavibacteriales bacterium]
EGLLVIDGLLNLTIDGTTIKVNSGELFVVPSGVVHGVGPGSAGTLVVFDV